MKFKSCIICGNPSARKYCSSDCSHKGELARKRKLYKKKGKHICVICMKPVLESHKKLHTGECTDIYETRRYDKKRLKVAKKNVLQEKICETCGDAFKSYSKIRRYCYNPICFKIRAKQNNQRSRAVLVEKRKNGVVAPKIRLKPEQKNILIEHINILAQCPRCGIKHKINVINGSSKWIYCNQCKHLVYYCGYANGLDFDNCNNYLTI